MATSPTYIVTVMCHPDAANLDSSLVHRIAKNLGGISTACLAENIAYDIVPDPAVNYQTLQGTLNHCLVDQNIDYAVVKAANRKKKLLIADMDSTMIDQECIDELADYAGFKAQVSQITARAMNGELEFGPALKERVRLLKGLEASVIDEVMRERISLASGGKTLVGTMKAHGAYCALVSGGFTDFTGRVGALLGFDENRANRLIAENGSLTGEVADPILGSDAKVRALNEISEKLSIHPDDAIAVGDGANDLPMLKTAGLGVALHAKPTVAAQAHIKVNHADLTSLLYIQGYTRDEIHYA